MPATRRKSKAQTIPSSSTSSSPASDSDIASSPPEPSRAKPPAPSVRQNGTPSVHGRAAVAKPGGGGGGLTFTTSQQNQQQQQQQQRQQQGKLSFVRKSGPAPVSKSSAPARKKVKIEEPPARSIDFKGKGKATDFDLEDAALTASVDAIALTTSPWSQRYSPRSRAELAVHPRKVSDVAAWLQDAFYGRPSLRKKRRLLLLTGPTGAAKTETLWQLAQDPALDFEVNEWKNETVARAGEAFDVGDGEVSSSNLSMRLRDFFSKSARFPTLKMQGGQPQTSSSSSADPTPNRRRRRLLLLEDLPALSHQPTLETFRDALATFITQPPGPDDEVVPVCVILSDVTGPGAGSDGDLASVVQDRRETEWMRPRRLLGDTVASSDAWFQIKFNPVAPTLLKRSLKATSTRAIDKTSRFPVDQFINAIAGDSPGDVRAAVDVLHQAYRAFQRDATVFADVVSAVGRIKGKRKTGDLARAADKEAKRVLQQLGLVSRDSALVLFHALGKLLYNKRVGDPDDNDNDGENEDEDEDDDGEESREGQNGSQGSSQSALPPLPAHYEHLARRPSRVDVNSITASGLDLTYLGLFAHHNYTHYTTDIEQCEGILEGFSFADSELHVKSDDQYNTRSLCELYTSLVTSHSVLLHLPSPVPRGVNPPRPPTTKPDLFEANVLSRETTAQVAEMQKRLGFLNMRPRDEVSQEWLPILGKMVASSSTTTKMPSEAGSARMRREDQELLRRLNNFVPGLAPFATRAARRFGGGASSFDQEEDDLAALAEEAEQSGPVDVDVTAEQQPGGAVIWDGNDDDGDDEGGSDAEDIEEIDDF